MFIERMSEKKTIILLIVIAYLPRILIAPFHIAIPYEPHDFYAYIGPGKCTAEGKFSLMDCLSWNKESRPAVYGPLISTIYSIAYIIFGQYDFFMYKVFAIVFDMGNIVLLYFLTKKLLNAKLAVYASLIYCLSFMPIMNSAVLGNDEMILIFFFLLSTYFLVTKRLALSSVIYSMTLLMKPFSIVIAPAIFFYMYKKYSFKSSFKFAIFSSICFLLTFSLFVLIGGLEKTMHYLIIGSAGAEKYYSSTLSIYNIFKLITNINMGVFINFVIAFSMIITLFFALKFQIKNLEIELLRNITLLILVTLFFGNLLSGIYTIIFFPFFLILLLYKIKPGTVRFDWIHLFGFLLIFVGLVVYSMIYREGLVIYSATDRILLILALLATTTGEFYLFHNFEIKMRLVLTMIALSSLMFLELYAAPLMVFPLKYFTKFIDVGRFTVINKTYGDHVGGRPDLLLAYGIFYTLPAVILYICLATIYVKMLRISSE